MRLAISQQRKITRVRKKIRELGAIRLTVRKTSQHIYAQVFSSNGSKVLASASSLEKSVKESINTDKIYKIGKIKIAELVGSIIAERMKEKGIVKVAFDRSGFKFHGRIKALAKSVCENGVKC